MRIDPRCDLHTAEGRDYNAENYNLAADLFQRQEGSALAFGASKATTTSDVEDLMAGEETLPHQRPGQWVQAGITGMAFPAEVTEVTFRGRTLYLIPGKTKGEDKFGGLYPLVAFDHGGMSFEDGQRLISGFINSIAWVRKEGIQTAMFGGGTRVHGLGGKDPLATLPLSPAMTAQGPDAAFGAIFDSHRPARGSLTL